MAQPEPIPPEIPPMDLANHLFETMESFIIKITRKQRTPDWFLGRSFRVTSTTAHHVVNCVAAPYFISDDLRNLHRAAKITAQLTPTASVSNAADLTTPPTHARAPILGRTGRIRGDKKSKE